MSTGLLWELVLDTLTMFSILPVKAVLTLLSDSQPKVQDRSWKPVGIAEFAEKSVPAPFQIQFVETIPLRIILATAYVFCFLALQSTHGFSTLYEHQWIRSIYLSMYNKVSGCGGQPPTKCFIFHSCSIKQWKSK